MFDVTERTRRSALAYSVVSAGLVLIAGCGGTSTPSAAGPSASPTGTPVAVTPAPSSGPGAVQRAAALAAYRGMWQDMVVASRTSDYQSPLLEQHASGTALSQLYKGLYASKLKGVVARGAPVLHPYVSAVNSASAPTRVTVMDCSDDSRWLNYKPDGQLEDNVPGGRRRVEALVLPTGGVWKVDQLLVLAVGTC